VDALAKTAQPELPPLPLEGASTHHARRGERPVAWGRAEVVTTPVLDGERLRPGNRFAGPVVVEYQGTTLVVPAGWTGEMDSYRNAVLARSGA
jgi:N-methylhydantoinase A